MSLVVVWSDIDLLSWTVCLVATSAYYWTHVPHHCASASAIFECWLTGNIFIRSVTLTTMPSYCNKNCWQKLGAKIMKMVC